MTVTMFNRVFRGEPLPANAKKSTTPMSAVECIAHLQELAEANPGVVITRALFRKHGAIAEKVWETHFESFGFYKMAAGIDNRRLMQRGILGAPPIPAMARPPEGMVVVRNGGEYDASGNLRRQWVQTAVEPGEEFEVPTGHVVKGESALELVEVGDYPTAVGDAVGQDAIYVGRVRQGLDDATELNLWITSDNVRKGASLNAVQIAELLIKHYL